MDYDAFVFRNVMNNIAPRAPAIICRMMPLELLALAKSVTSKIGCIAIKQLNIPREPANKKTLEGTLRILLDIKAATEKASNKVKHMIGK